MKITDATVKAVLEENERCRKAFGERGLDIDEFDTHNTCNDWVAYICGYAGRGSDMFRNRQEGLGFREAMVKSANLAMAAIEAFDAGHCK